MTTPIRSWLYCPGHLFPVVEKALASRADAVVLDLEDAVPVERKQSAREAIALALALPRSGSCWVRINPPDSPWGTDDLRAVRDARPDGIRIAKSESVDAVRRAADATGVPVSLIIETPLGVERAFELATAHPLVVSLSLGEADLQASLRADEEGLDWARSRIINAARAAGLASPPQSVYTDVADQEGLRISTSRGRARGFFGRSVIHPRQIDIVHDVFTPSQQEIAQARRVVDQLRDARRSGRSAFLDDTGSFIDPAVADRAAFILSLHERLQAAPTETDAR